MGLWYKIFSFSPVFHNRITGGVFFYLIVNVFLTPLYADSTGQAIRLTQSDATYRPGPYLDLSEDPGGETNLAELLSGSKLFFRNRIDTPTLGFTDSFYWVRLKIENHSNQTSWLLELDSSSIEIADFYESQGPGQYRRLASGSTRPFSRRAINHRNHIFRIDIAKGKSKTVYLHVANQSSLHIPLMLHTAPKIFSRERKNQYIFGIYYGALIVMGLYNLFLFISIRDTTYFYYVLYLLSFIFFQLSDNGLGPELLWPDNIWLGSNRSIPIFAAATGLFAILFTRKFLFTKEYIPRLDKFILGVGLLGIIPLGLVVLTDLTGEALALVSLQGFIFSPLLLLTGALCVYRRAPSALFYLIAWVALLLGILLVALRTTGYVPSNILTNYAIQIGAGLEALLLSLGLAHRFRSINEELSRLKNTLEIQVRRRTTDLDLALQKLKQKDDLIQVELDLARDIQQGIAPPTPYHYRGLLVETWSKPAGKVSGDFYDIFPLPGGRLGVLLADGSGHGIPAAFITAMAKICFSDAIRLQSSPARIFALVNESLLGSLNTPEYLTAFLVVIEAATGRVCYSNAAHQRALVLRKTSGEIEYWDSTGLILGKLGDARETYQDKNSVLEPGDRIFLYTDGLRESRQIFEKERQGLQRLEEILQETRDSPAPEACRHIAELWENSSDQTGVNDDATFLIIEYQAPHPPPEFEEN